VKIVADAGPLIALAKVDGLDVLFGLYPHVLTPPAVYEEAVSAGVRLGAPDADVLDLHYRKGFLGIAAPRTIGLPLPEHLGRGEEESIRLAIEQRADWLLMDDLDARQAALASFEATGALTRIRGTLGIVSAASEERRIPRDRAVAVVHALSQRPDIWISADLCWRVLDLLKKMPE
jgi:predicted nucleic acid-binding protein